MCIFLAFVKYSVRVARQLLSTCSLTFFCCLTLLHILQALFTMGTKINDLLD